MNVKSWKASLQVASAHFVEGFPARKCWVLKLVEVDKAQVHGEKIHLKELTSFIVSPAASV